MGTNPGTEVEVEVVEPTQTSAVRPSLASTPMQERRVDSEIRVSKFDVGSLIGKGGTNIRKIQQDTNTRITPSGECKI